MHGEVRRSWWLEEWCPERREKEKTPFAAAKCPLDIFSAFDLDGPEYDEDELFFCESCILSGSEWVRDANDAWYANTDYKNDESWEE